MRVDLRAWRRQCGSIWSRFGAGEGEPAARDRVRSRLDQLAGHLAATRGSNQGREIQYEDDPWAGGEGVQRMQTYLKMFCVLLFCTSAGLSATCVAELRDVITTPTFDGAQPRADAHAGEIGAGGSA